MLKVTFALEDTTFISEVVNDGVDQFGLPKQSGWRSRVVFMTAEDIQEDRGPTGEWSFPRDLTDLELSALLALAAGLGELTDDGERQKASASVDLFYAIVEPLLVDCPSEGRPVP